MAVSASHGSADPSQERCRRSIVTHACQLLKCVTGFAHDF